MLKPHELEKLSIDIKQWARELGFQHVGIADVNLKQHEAFLQSWLDKGYHGDMDYMAEHGTMRSRPDELMPGTVRVISVGMNYLPPDASFAHNLKNTQAGYVSRYALGRDYHKVLRQRLKKLGQKITQCCQSLSFRPFVDSAPVLEHALAEKAGIGWTGKHSLTLNKQSGSWFFLGELFINIPLPTDEPMEESCGDCVACMTICPTNAIVAPYVVDGRKCISYLTIENKGAIPEEYRKAIGNRIYGCDDCQLVCPWNRYGQITDETDFSPRALLHQQPLVVLFSWSEETFLKNTEGSPIRRIGFESWQRNIAVAMGNADYDDDIINALTAAQETATDMVREHIEWALRQQQQSGKHQSSQARKTLRLIRTVEKGMPRDA